MYIFTLQDRIIYYMSIRLISICTQKSSLKSKNQSRIESTHKPDPDNKGDLMSWVKRKISPEKEADTTPFSKQLRSDRDKNSHHGYFSRLALPH